MKKMSLLVLLMAVPFFVFASGASESDGQEKTVLKFGHLANEEHTWHLAALRFKEIVESESKGLIEVQVYPNEQLGKEIDLLNGIQAGVVDMTITGESMQNFNAPYTAMLGLPYLISDSAHLQTVMNGAPGQKIADQIQERLGFYPLAYFERGPRNLTSNRPINTPADLNGMILRVPNVPLFVSYWTAAGAKPTPMAFSEVFTGLQQGTVEGQENPLSLIYSANFYEVQDYVNLTEHVIGWIYVVIGEKKLRSLSADMQEIVINAGKEMQRYEHELFLKDEQELVQILQDRGMTFNPVDKAAFEQVATEVIFDALTPEQQDIYNEIIGLK